MIYDGLSALGLYRGLSRGLDVLIDWLDGNDPASLPIGRTEILGDKVFANVMNARTRTPEDARFETHRRYMARSAVIARDCGADVAVVLTKADRASDEVLVRDVSAIRDVLGEGTHCVLTSSEAERAGGGERDRITAAAASCDVPFGVGAVYGLVPAGVVAIVLGESGAGKSTLLNALLGRDVLETCAVREADDAGRHTTVSRRMVRIPRGGVIVDEPGLRSLPIVGHERGLAKVFPEIAHGSAD